MWFSHTGQQSIIYMYCIFTWTFNNFCFEMTVIERCLYTDYISITCRRSNLLLQWQSELFNVLGSDDKVGWVGGELHQCPLSHDEAVSVSFAWSCGCGHDEECVLDVLDARVTWLLAYCLLMLRLMLTDGTDCSLVDLGDNLGVNLGDICQQCIFFLFFILWW